MDAIGHPIPAGRMSAAYRAVKEMIPDIGTADAMALVGRMAQHLERDEPYEALACVTDAPLPGNPSVKPSRPGICPVLLDMTGGYRLMAHLLT
jgi:hypothetical protein